MDKLTIKQKADKIRIAIILIKSSDISIKTKLQHIEKIEFFSGLPNSSLKYRTTFYKASKALIENGYIDKWVKLLEYNLLEIEDYLLLNELKTIFNHK